MDDATKKAIVTGVIANAPELVSLARTAIRQASDLSRVAGLTEEEIDAEWRAARSEGMSLDPTMLPDANP